VLRKRGYITVELCLRVIQAPIWEETQRDGRIRKWAFIPELGGRALRVVTLADGDTIHNAFLDRRFTPERLQRLLNP
jgi:hypothetical protein